MTSRTPSGRRLDRLDRIAADLLTTLGLLTAVAGAALVVAAVVLGLADGGPAAHAVALVAGILGGALLIASGLPFTAASYAKKGLSYYRVDHLAARERDALL